MYLLNYWHILISKGMCGVMSNTLLITMLTTQDKHNQCCQKVARAVGQSSTGCRFGSEQLRFNFIKIKAIDATLPNEDYILR